MKKFLILARRSEEFEFRVRRLREEIGKRNAESEVVFVEEAKVFIDKVEFDGSRIDFSKFDYLISVGTPDANLYIVELACAINPALKTWPNPGSHIMRDKFSEGIFLDKFFVPTPKTVLLNGLEEKLIEESVEGIGGFPCVAKKVTGASGEYVELIGSAKEVVAFVEKLATPSIIGKRNIILQEYIEESRGTDFRVFCVGNEILGAIQRTASDDNFKANISLGGKAKQIEVTEEMERYAKIIMKEGKMMFAGIDFIKSNRGYLVLEINISANFEGFEGETKVNIAGRIIEEFMKH